MCCCLSPEPLVYSSQRCLSNPPTTVALSFLTPACFIRLFQARGVILPLRSPFVKSLNPRRSIEVSHFNSSQVLHPCPAHRRPSLPYPFLPVKLRSSVSQ